MIILISLIKSNHFNLFFFITVKDWLALIPPTAATAGVIYITYLAFCPEAKGLGCPGRKRVTARVNKTIKLESDKVADLVDVEVSSMTNCLKKLCLCNVQSGK